MEAPGIPSIFESFASPATLPETLLLWSYLNNYLSKCIAHHWRKEFYASAVTDLIVNDRSLEAPTTLLYGTYDLALDSSETRRIARFTKQVELLLVYAVKTIIPRINQDEVTRYYTLEDFLSYTGFKVSQFFVGMSGLLTDLDSAYFYTEGFWSFDADIIDEIATPVSYHFELDVATDINFINILYSLDSEAIQTGWSYLDPTSDVFVAVPVAGVNSSFEGSRIKYESTSSQYLTRGETYYFRIRQKANAINYNYRRFSDIIYT